ncbi:MAG: O-antigen ligase domain-containing protein [Paracoccaceae bacterium]
MTTLPQIDRIAVANAPVTKVRTGLPVPAILYLLALVIPIGFNAGPLFLTLVRALLLVMVIPLLIRLLTGRYGRILATDIFFLLYLVWMTLALAITSPAQVMTQSGSVGIEFIGGYLIGRAYIRDKGSFIALCRWLTLLVLILVPFALHETMTGRPLILEYIRRIPGLTSVSIVSIESRMGLERVQSVFAHPIHYGLFCSVAFSLCFVALKDVYSVPRRLISSLLIMLSGFLALSSGALLAIILQIALIAWSLIFARIRWRWWLLVGLFALAYVAIDILSSRPPIRVFMSYATFSAHNAYWRGIIFDWGLKNVLGDASVDIPPAPWFGLGMNDWVRPWFMHSGSMDNFWLVIAVRYGIPALLLLAAGYALAIYHVMRRNFDADPLLLQIRRAWVLTFLGLTFTLCTVFVWTNIYSFVFFMFGAGIWLIAVPTTDPASGIPDSVPPGKPKERDTRPRHTRFPKPGAATV